ncbi:hypothetical protein LRS10_21265 [Phenylobacterium sp. J426]|uniref:hypothetical protein n=1 Tax=Phenylobacterium sp. J426 TaxID=2898439 RepID=UPI002150EAB4|nr:hypothetical protein [Phenylobacterium sp. J426]MCR5876450.1 hypothetical protein [Phenylobacterium sp. J426]
MVLRALAVPAALAALMFPGSAGASDAGLIGRLSARSFVVPDARGAPVPLEFSAPHAGVVEVRIAGEVTDRYRIDSDGGGEHVHAAAPDLVSQATFAPDSWSRSYKGLTVTYALSPEGDLVGRLSGAVEAWQAPRFVYAHNPHRPDLARRLRDAVERAHAEADRYEGHDHDHDHEDGPAQ